MILFLLPLSHKIAFFAQNKLFCATNLKAFRLILHFFERKW